MTSTTTTVGTNTLPPVINSTSLSDDQIFYNDYVLWIFVADNVGLSRAEVLLDGEPFESSRFNDTKTDHVNHLLDVYAVPNGAHTVTISVNDVNGNILEESYTLTVDKPGFLYR